MAESGHDKGSVGLDALVFGSNVGVETVLRGRDR